MNLGLFWWEHTLHRHIRPCNELWLGRIAMMRRTGSEKNWFLLWWLGPCSLSSVQSLSHGRLFATPWIIASQATQNQCEFCLIIYASSSCLFEVCYKLNCQSVQLLSCVQLFVTPWISARQASLFITISRSSLRLMSIESMMPSSHLILCLPLLLLPPIPPSIRVFSNESTLLMRWPKYWSFSFSIFLPKKSQGWSPSEWTGWISLQSKGLSRVFSNTTVQKHQFFGAQPSSQSNSHIHTWPQEKP